MTMAEFVKSEGGGVTALCTVSVWTRAMLGLEPSEVSALYFLDYCKSGGGLMQMRSDGKNGGQYLRIVEGTQAFSEHLAASLKPDTLLLSSPVRSITQFSSGVSVSSARGDFHCKRVIVSVPTPLYKEIAFLPPLPSSKVALCATTKLGTYAKLIVAYSSPWWREAKLCGLSQSPTGPYCVTRDTSVDAKEHYALTCFLCGEPGRQWNRLSTFEARREAVIEQLLRMYGPFVPGGIVPQPKEVIEQHWIEEQWSQGCPCPAMPPGLLTEFGDVLREPFGNVHFVGTETAYEWKGYMEGAVRSGERGAAEVVAASGIGTAVAKL
ncbi:hypothetical protein LTS18_006302 [Coniosporium uncinatum]|uniref:Uncharacterized protein n=1 Tax=Coniosporium uncinatum TaxID=93489 RepID=A0ACC3D447_9PEZI|nr:hypothetical protein LTS18_006302 [Coniosporium uncinatum]